MIFRVLFFLISLIGPTSAFAADAFGRTLDPRIFDAGKNDDLNVLKSWRAQIYETVRSDWRHMKFAQNYAVIDFYKTLMVPTWNYEYMLHPSGMKFAVDRSPLVDTFNEIRGLGKISCAIKGCHLIIPRWNFDKVVQAIDRNLARSADYNYCVVQEVGAFGMESTSCKDVPTVMIRGYQAFDDCLQPFWAFDKYAKSAQSRLYSEHVYTQNCKLHIGRSNNAATINAEYAYESKDDLQVIHSDKASNQPFKNREEAFQAMMHDPQCF